ncbi:MAG TPA: VanW family protein [Candidatus Saccharimonadales bacterium]|nr:VanW family protein [Candidatus Saccharimonadales bacterium]
MAKTKTKKEKKIPKDKRKHSLVAIVFSAITIIVVVATAAVFIFFQNRFLPNIYISGVNMSAKTSEEASFLLGPKLKTPKSITLSYNDKKFDIPVDSLNIVFDKEKTVKNAISLGKSENLLKDIKDIYSLTKSRLDFPLELSLNENILSEKITKIADVVNIPSQNAVFTFTEGRVQNFTPESNGLSVEKDKLKELILTSIYKNDDSPITIAIPTKAVFPVVKTSDINNLGIKELIGSGTSHFAGSIYSRIYNINLASSRINNTLIAPNEIFSFNRMVGDISALNGYQQAYVIENGQTVLGDGGGVCQVSTTMFRAAMNTGLPIVERHAHAYRVHYYEEDAAPGLDATIYTPSVDFKFKNDTGNYILIQTQIDTRNLVLTFNLYGTSDGRVSNITKPVLWGYQPAPVSLYTDDPTLPVGQTKQIDFAASGIKSQFEYTVTKNGEVINHQVFYSEFKPWQAKFLRGTKV